MKVVEKEQFSLTIKLDKPAPVVWYKNGKPIDTTDARYQISNVDAEYTMTVPKSSPDDEAEFSVSVGDEKSKTKVIIESKL